MDERELLKQYAEGRTETAFRSLVELYMPMVYGSCLRRLDGDAHGAKEAAQAVFTVLAMKPDKIGAGTPLSGWLLTVARHTAAHMLRDRGRRAKYEREAAVMEDMRSEHTEMEENQLQALRGELDNALDALPSLLRHAVVLRYMEGRPFNQVGERLGCGVDAAKKRVERGLEQLRRRLLRSVGALTTTTLCSFLANEAEAACPPGLVETTVSLALDVSARAVGSSAATTTTLSMAKGVMMRMAIMKMKTIAAAAVGGALGIGVIVAVTYKTMEAGAVNAKAEDAAAVEAEKKGSPSKRNEALKPNMPEAKRLAPKSVKSPGPTSRQNLPDKKATMQKIDKPDTSGGESLSTLARMVPGLYVNRIGKGRGNALDKFGGGGAHIPAVRGLRWLADKQNVDGSWGASPGDASLSLTGLALLCALGHDETPDSEEFGGSVKKGLDWLADHAGSGGQEHNALAIATCALAEGYGMSKDPKLKDAMASAIRKLLAEMDNESGQADMSTVAWNCQALKAAYTVGSDALVLENAMNEMIEIIKTGVPAGWDGTTAFCLHLLGQGGSKEARSQINRITEDMTPGKCWISFAPSESSGSLSDWYFQTNALFQGTGGSGPAWEKWNKQMKYALISTQNSTGQWEPPPSETLPPGFASGSDTQIYATALATLCLEVYYRFLPTHLGTTNPPQ